VSSLIAVSGFAVRFPYQETAGVDILGSAEGMCSDRQLIRTQRKGIIMEEALTIKTLMEIDALLKRGVLPVNNAHLDHLSEEGSMLGDLLSMKREGLICGAVVAIGEIARPYRMTNIRLTCIGIRMLRSAISRSAIAS